jgi:hypothetical protein
VGADVDMPTLFAGVFGVLLSFSVLTLLVFWDARRSPPTTEPEEDYARRVGARKHERWLRRACRRMRIVRTDAKDGMVRMKNLRIVARWALSTKKGTNPTTSDDLDVRYTKDNLGITEAATENTANV